MAQVVKQFSYNTDLENWVFSAGGGTSIAGTRDTTEDSPNDSNAGTGVMQARRTGKNNKDGTPYWEWGNGSLTWESLGVPAGAVITAVNLDYDWRCSEYTTGASTSSTGPGELRDGAGTTVRGTFSAELTFGATSSWATRSGTQVTGLSDASNTAIRLRLGANPETGSSTSAAVTLRQDWVVVTITYSLVVTTTHSSDSLLKSVTTRVHTTDSLLRKTDTRGHTTDSFLASVVTKAHSSDSLLRATSTKPHSTDALLRTTATRAHSTDALLRAVVSRTHSTDSYLATAGLTKVHSTDALLRGTITKVHGTDALAYAVQSRAHSTDALFRSTVPKEHATDAFLRATFTRGHATDALLRAQISRAHATDALLSRTTTIAQTSDAFLAIAAGILVHSTDAYIQPRPLPDFVVGSTRSLLAALTTQSLLAEYTTESDNSVLSTEALL